METVSVQCVQCGKAMAVAKEHLGSQVSCPHCQGVVQTEASAPVSAAPSPAADVPEIKVATADSTESIFAANVPGAEADIFDTRAPVLELPPRSPPPRKPADDEAATMPASPSSEVLAAPGPKAEAEDRTATWPEPDKSAPAPDFAADVPTELAEQITPRRYTPKRSNLGPIMLIFLIPYAIFSTAFIAWLLYSNSKRPDPFEYLRDPYPNEK